MGRDEMGGTWNLLHREALLQCLVDIARDAPLNRKLVDIHVLFFPEAAAGGGPTDVLLETNFATAMDYIVNDTYWDENGDWSEAARIVIDPSY